MSFTTRHHCCCRCYVTMAVAMRIISSSSSLLSHRLDLWTSCLIVIIIVAPACTHIHPPPQWHCVTIHWQYTYLAAGQTHHSCVSLHCGLDGTPAGMYCSPLPLPLPFHRLAPVSVPPLLSLSTIMLYYCGTGCAQQLVIQLVIIVPLCSGPLVIIVTLPHCCCCHCHHCCYCCCCCHCSGPHPLILSFCAAVALARQSARHCGAMAVAARLIVSIVPVLPHQHHHFHVLSLLLVLVISTSSYDSITYYHGLPYLLPTCFSFIAAL